MSADAAVLRYMGGHRIGLASGLALPATLARLHKVLGIPKADLRKALQRLRKRGEVRFREGEWT